MNNISRAILPQSLPDQIAEWLVIEISEERLKPEQRVTEQYVAEQCSVSRGPVRDAFRIVEKLGLIRILPRKGVVVCPLDINELKELFEIRAALVRVAVCHVIDNATDDELQIMLNHAILLQSQTVDEDAFFKASNDIGDVFGRLAQSHRLMEMLAPLGLQIMRYRHHGFSSLAARDASALGYVMVAEAMMSRNKNKALAAVDSATENLVAEVEKAFNANN